MAGGWPPAVDRRGRRTVTLEGGDTKDRHRRRYARIKGRNGMSLEYSGVRINSTSIANERPASCSMWSNGSIRSVSVRDRRPPRRLSNRPEGCADAPSALRRRMEAPGIVVGARLLRLHQRPTGRGVGLRCGLHHGLGVSMSALGAPDMGALELRRDTRPRLAHLRSRSRSR